ncbi:hypothetical protein H6F67_22005 [Microcoleus sp. FACHB-1515]|uniref:hypothetical protein n=1 Tax=Cyanophyceae TaxID=3028117 RepID=UPI001685D91E|nr:hypothetical protein [Microcoleus sp. FACHB-1515]MBD2092526.1 hypothetical protein [Microcoleus sp. FACHB-1515]
MTISSNCWWLLKLAGHAITAWLALSLTAFAAEPMGLDFELAADLPADLPAESEPVRLMTLPVVGQAPIGSETPEALPPPPEPERSPSVQPAESPATLPPTDNSPEIAPAAQPAKLPAENLDFTLAESSTVVNVPIAPPRNERDRPSVSPDLFAGGSESLVAKAIGSAEGTRTPTGGYTWAYRGHVDPGNSAWNLGSFSYQHGATSPQEADRKQLARLQTQAETLRQQADRYQMTLTLAETLNGLDLANQSPRAALSRGGYIDRLHQAHEMGLRDADAILWARTRAFLDPDTSRWNAPGLGNNVHSITADQDRRRRAIERAIASHN